MLPMTVDCSTTPDVDHQMVKVDIVYNTIESAADL